MQETMLKEVIFSVSLNLDDIYVAEAFCYSITVQANSLDELRCRIRTAVQFHFEAIEPKPALIRLHFAHHEKISIFQSPDQESQWKKACSQYSEHASFHAENAAKPILGFKQPLQR